MTRTLQRLQSGTENRRCGHGTCGSGRSEYPNKVLTGHTERIRPCIACNQGCITRLQQGKAAVLAVNPAAMREIRFALNPVFSRNRSFNGRRRCCRNGGGTGCDTSRPQGFLYEKNQELGGNLIPWWFHRFKKEVRELNAWYQNELSLLPVEVHTGRGSYGRAGQK